MKDVECSFMAGFLAAVALLGYVLMEFGEKLWAVKAVVLHGPAYPCSHIPNVAALLMVLGGVAFSVGLGTLVLIRSYGRRVSGAMLRETNVNAQRDMPGMEGLRGKGAA